MLLLPRTHARSVENCQRSFFSYPKDGQDRPTVLYGMLPAKLTCGGPASPTSSPLCCWDPQSRWGQFAPAERLAPPMYHRSQATVEWLIMLLLMIQSHCLGA